MKKRMKGKNSNRSKKSGRNISKKSHQKINRAFEQGEKILKQALNDPIVKEYLEEQKALLRKTVRAGLIKLEKELNKKL